MSILEQLQEQAKAALKAGQKEQVGSLRLLISEIKKLAIDERRELDQEAELQVLKRERKKRLEAIEAYRAGNRPDLAEHEEREVVMIDQFLPSQLDEAATGALVDEAIAEVGATSPKEMGKVMSAVMAKGGAQIDGKLASRLVKERLSA